MILSLGALLTAIDLDVLDVQLPFINKQDKQDEKNEQNEEETLTRAEKAA